MTADIGITITAANSGTEPGRIERLLDVLAIVHSLLDRNVIDMSDEDTQEGAYTAFVKALASIHDNKGSLIVSWRRRPSQRWKDAFKTAWEANCEHDVQHVMI
ncbi:MAG: hypothetical protein WBX25_33655 [Rhodomicrobium sp.]